MDYYDEDYFNWQKNIGAFGGVANLFKFENEIKDSDNVIDIGCGGGFLLKNINSKGKIGYDINESAIKNAISNGINATNDLNKIEDNWADVIISNHALEHVDNPMELLKKIKKKLKKSGKIVFVVPHQSTNEDFIKDDVNMHIYTWNQLTLGNLFKKAGYIDIDVEAFQHQWPKNYIKFYEKKGKEKFHKKCKRFAKRNNNFQIKIIAKK